jgi:orotidine-5'-phosphate decarboxylase
LGRVPAPLPEPFADRVLSRARALGHPLCAGLDPDLARIPAPFRRGAMEPAAPETAEAVASFCRAFLERAAGRVAALKPQSAFFEALGWRGVRVLSELLADARARGLPVVLDAKRGDIGSTAEGYAAAYLALEAPLRADALTLNPYLGLDALEPFLREAERARAGLFVLARTSNPGGRDFQDVPDAAGRPLYERVAEALGPFAKRLAGPATGFSGLGLVAGATRPEEARRLRELAPSALFLVPGYGAQGASAREAVAGFVRGPGGRLEGGLVNAARALHFPAAADASARAWERAVDDALDRAASDLSDATAGRVS